MGTIKFTDPFFAKAIADLSANHTLFFIPKQLHYFLDRRLKSKSTMSTSGFGCIYLFLGFFVWFLGGGFLSTIMGANVLPLVLIGYNLLWIFILYGQSNSATAGFAARRSAATTLQILGALIALIGAIYGVSVGSVWLFGSTTLIGLVTLWLGFWQKRRVNQIPESFLIKAEDVQDWLDRWTRINGSVPQLPSRPNTLSSASPSPPNPDVTTYSFDRLVVCQSDAIAQMLIANNFHFENNCAILSISGYPQRIFQTTLQMLRRNPNLCVFALHDCSSIGASLVHQLRTDPNWFPDSNIVVVDVGLSPRQVLAAKRPPFTQQADRFVRLSQNLAPAIRQNLSQEELRWLDAGNVVELECFTPQTLIQILQRSISSSQQLESLEEGGLILIGDGGQFYATESFG
jgi:predicted small integral membrane protein